VRADTVARGGSSRLPDVFLSYSRRDSEFVRRLADALHDRGKDVWVDVEGIRDAEVFPEALRRAVERSDAFVFVITPDSVRSPFCELEIERAGELNKRIVPVYRRPVDDAELPDEVRYRNWIPAEDDAGFGTTIDRLITALDTDLEWDREHSRLTVKALEWERSGRDRSFLLRGSDLGAAEKWLASGAGHDPGPSGLESEYILAARTAAGRRQRNLVVASLAVAAVSVALLVFALISRSDAIHARNGAKAQALTSDAERVGAQALVEKNLDLAMLYAALGVKLQNNLQTRGDLLAELQDNPFAIKEIHPSNNQILSLAVGSRGDLLATGDTAGVVRFEDMSRWTPSGSPITLGGSIPWEAMAFSPRGDTLAVLTEGGSPEGPIQVGRTNLYAIDVATRRVRLLGSWQGVFASVPYPAASLAYDPSGRFLALSLLTTSPAGDFTADTLALLDASTGRTVWRRRYPLVAGQSEARVEFAPDGSLLTSAQQGETLLWNARTGRVQRRFAIGGQPAISPNGQTVALAVNSPDLSAGAARIAILNLRSGRYRFLLASVPSVWLRGFAFTPDATSIVGETTHGDVYVWDVASGSITETIPAPPGARASEVLDPTGRTVLVGSQAGTVVASDLSGGRRLGLAFHWNTPDHACSSTVCFVVDRQSKLMAVDQGDGSVALIDLRTLRRTATLPPRDGSTVSGLALFPDGGTLLTGDTDGHLTFWDVRSRQVVRTIRLGEPVWSAAVSPDGRLLAAQTQAESSPNSEVQVRPVEGAKPLWTHEVQDGTGGLDFSPDGREVAALGCCTSFSTVVSWGSRSGQQLFRSRVANHATAIAYSPDSRLLAVGTEDGQVLFWNALTGIAQVPPLHVSPSTVSGISFSPDGTLMAVSSYDGSTTLWDLRSHQQIGSSFPERPSVITTPLFEPNGRLLIDYNADAEQWPTDVDSWERFACQVAGPGPDRGRVAPDPADASV
jgi:WD40 repeat protein